MRNYFRWVAVFVALASSPASASENIPPPGEARFIDKHDATSDCIGDAKTPLCAVESWIAGNVRPVPPVCLNLDLADNCKSLFLGGRDRVTYRGRNRVTYRGRDRVTYSVMDVVRPPNIEVSGAPAPPVEITLIESNNYFRDGWYLDNEMVIRSQYVITRYRVEELGGKWQVTERIECADKDRTYCRTSWLKR